MKTTTMKVQEWTTAANHRSATRQKIAVVDSDKESTESVSTGKNDKADELALIDEAIAEAEQYIVGATDLLVGTETEN